MARSMLQHRRLLGINGRALSEAKEKDLHAIVSSGETAEVIYNLPPRRRFPAMLLWRVFGVMPNPAPHIPEH